MSLEQDELTSTVKAPINEPYARIPSANVMPIGNFDLIRRWMPTGYRVVVETPFISNDMSPLFAIKVTPLLPSTHITYNGGTELMGLMRYAPIYPNPNSFGPQDKPTITVTRYAEPPLLGVLAHYYRYWSGSLKYRIRTISSFVSSGCIYSGILRSTNEWISTSESDLDVRVNNRFIYGCNDSLSHCIHAHTVVDPSMFRHMETEVPYQEMTPVKDLSYECLNPASARHSFLTFYNVGTLATGAEKSVITFEIDICAGDDFMFYSEIGPPQLSSTLGYNWKATSLFTYPLPKPTGKEKSDEMEVDNDLEIDLVCKRLGVITQMDAEDTCI